MSGTGGLKGWIKGPPRPGEKAKKGALQLDRRRIAVLPFSNMSPDPSDEYFADGMTEELIATVSKIGEISVVSRTSVMQYRKNPKSIRDVAEELQTGTILEGSVRKARDKVRVTVQLVDAAQDKHLWSESYDRSLEDIFAIQSDISQNVAEVLKVQLLAREVGRLQNVPTRNTEAYTLFLKGREYLSRRTEEAFQRAIHMFEESLKRDARYASAYAGLSESYILLEGWGFMSPKDAWPKVLGYATRALELDDSLAEAHTSLALCLEYMRWDWKGAESEFRRALALNPSYANGHHWYAYDVLQYQGRWDEAIREINQAEALDPLSSIIAVNKGRILFWSGKHKEAMEQFKLALELNPEFAPAHTAFGTALVATSSIQEGTAELEKALKLSTDEPWRKADLAYAYVAAGRRMEAEKILRGLIEEENRKYVSGTLIAAVYAALGEKELAFERLNKAVQEGTSTLFLNMSTFDNLRTDPRFENLRERMGLKTNPASK